MSDTARVLVLNGPNLGRLGTREPDVYGSTSHAELAALCVRGGAELGLDVEVRQSDHEGELIGWLHEAADAGVPVVLNAGALTHTSVGVGDACAMLTAPLVEVHISNVFSRESFRHTSYVSPHAAGVIVGFGVEGYVLALSWLSASVAAVRGDGDDG
ncbi:MAG: 3-dehydroquinate dehydratase [Pseudonocardiales bacterium]|jgi:3-dehydroquinate dehydratase-2|nr:3-dehydroquinate dehydratase [Pseudonocardiales bacterium]MDT4941283.1 3-dehydroquinate dehydratase [Pseudonocardiales bacterium]MDT7753993.1 3-dehydroquinate dehydratase [Pseudonocardiales bacterium]